MSQYCELRDILIQKKAQVSRRGKAENRAKESGCVGRCRSVNVSVWSVYRLPQEGRYVVLAVVIFDK